MKPLRFWRKKLIKAGVVLLLIAAGVGGYLGYRYFQTKQDKKIEQEIANNDPFALQDIQKLSYESEYQSVSDIKGISDPQERYDSYIRTAGYLFGAGKFEESLKYHEAAFDVSDIDEAQRKQDLYNGYQIAIAQGVKSYEDKFYEKLGGASGIESITAAFPRESQTE